MFKLYSERNADPNELPDVYEYDNIPDKFRNQFFYVLEDVFDNENVRSHYIWDNISTKFSRHIGVRTLPSRSNSPKGQVYDFLLSAEIIQLLDFIDFASHIMNNMKTATPFCFNSDLISTIDDAIKEINERFRQNNLGYEFVNGELIRIDNKLLHKEIIKPALHLLQSEEFKGAEEEFFKAFEYRRNSDNKSAILEALKAFESTMKTICEKKSYPYDPAKNTAKNLIVILESNNFYPSYMSSHITSLRITLETGLPTLRNKQGSHGQGATVVNVSDEFAEYALNLAATNIVLLVKIYQSQK